MVNGTDVTVTSGSSIVFASALTNGDIVEAVTFGTFSVANLNASNLTSGTVPDARITGAYTGITNLTMSGDLTVDTNTLKVDSSNNNVGIGTASPNSITNLHVADTYANEPMIRIETSDSGNKRLDLYVNGGHGYVTATQSAQSLNFASRENLIFKTNTSSERARIDASGNLLLGATSVQGGTANTLQIADGSSARLLLQNTGGGRTYGFFAGTDGKLGLYDYSASAQRLAIDTSGNIFVAKTSAAYQTVGHELLASGRAFHTASGGKALSLVRLSSDGAIVDFYKDGTEIGNIGAKGGYPYFAHSSGSGIKIVNNEIRPSDNTGGTSDNAVDLGTSSRRFKDIYLGGGIALGGTGTANTLSDYEEGTWTPDIRTSGNNYSSVTHSAQTGSYTKVGRLVTAHFIVTISAVTIGSATGNINIGGLPFTCNNTQACGSAIDYVSNMNYNLSSFGALHVGINARQNLNLASLTKTGNSRSADGLHNTSIAQNTSIQGVLIYYVD